MKDKVKRQRILNERKSKGKKLDEQHLKQEEIEANRLKQEYQERKADYEELQILRKKLDLAKEYNLEMDVKFKSKEHEYENHAEFLKAFKENKKKRQLVIEKLELEFKEKNKAYKFKWETGSFKFKRWFFGMGKEFTRISWASKKDVGSGFLIVFSIVIFLALVFLAIQAIFSAGLFS